MKASKFTEAQIAFVLKQAEDGTPIGEVCRKGATASQTDRHRDMGVSIHAPVKGRGLYPEVERGGTGAGLQFPPYAEGGVRGLYRLAAS